MRARSSRLAPWVVLALLTVALVVTALLVVPWSTVPGVEPTPARDFTAAQLARDTAFHHDLRGWTYPRAALVLLVTLVLGLTPVGEVRCLAKQAHGPPLERRLGNLSAGQDRPQRGNVGDGTAHRADRVERGAEREDAVDWDVPEPRLESDRLTGG